MAVFAGLAANTLWDAWWLEGVVTRGIAGYRPGTPSIVCRPAATTIIGRGG
jgi:hypothetical protein